MSHLVGKPAIPTEPASVVFEVSTQLRADKIGARIDNRLVDIVDLGNLIDVREVAVIFVSTATLPGELEALSGGGGLGGRRHGLLIC